MAGRDEMTEAFADTFFFIALLNPKDQHHLRVRAAFSADQFRIVTTTWILVELADAFALRSVRAQIHRFVANAIADPTMTVATEPEWLHRGLELFGMRADKDWSLTDCISFAVMKERGLTHALTGDRHFAQAGFISMFS
jgi:uncharacterized protein